MQIFCKLFQRNRFRQPCGKQTRQTPVVRPSQANRSHSPEDWSYPRFAQCEVAQRHSLSGGAFRPLSLRLSICLELYRLSPWARHHVAPIFQPPEPSPPPPLAPSRAGLPSTESVRQGQGHSEPILHRVRRILRRLGRIAPFYHIGAISYRTCHCNRMQHGVPLRRRRSPIPSITCSHYTGQPSLSLCVATLTHLGKEPL